MNHDLPEPAQSYLQLRNRMFHLNPAEVGLSQPPASQHIWAVLVETGYDVGTSTLVCLADGTTSLYYSTGGGMVGSSKYSPVADPAKALVAEAEIHIDHLAPTTDFRLPDIGEVRIYYLTYEGILTETAAEKDMSSGQHVLSPLYQHAQRTLTQLRLLADKKRQYHGNPSA